MEATTYAAAVRELTQRLASGFPEREARVLALRLFSARLNEPEYRCWTDPQTPVAEAVRQQWELDVAELLAQRPWQYVVGQAEFEGRAFRVNESVLIPRPETEELLRLAVDAVRTRFAGEAPVSCMDLCTGSGCLAWSLAGHFPAATVYAVDWSEAALEVASHQVFPDIPQAPHFERADVLAGVPATWLSPDFSGPKPGTWTAMVSNPPYVRECERAEMEASVLDYEPEMALFVPDQDPLLFYRALADWAETLLCPGGMAFWEINEALGEELCADLKARGFASVELRKDFRDRPRFVLFEKSSR
jgi:release factor glutamine methyltransferase